MSFARHYAKSRPMTARVRRYLRVWRANCPSTDWVFPGAEDPNSPVPRDTVTKWPGMFFARAGIKKPKGLGFHGARRQWASARRGYAIADLREAGGWRSNEVVLGYIQATEADIDRVALTPTHRV
jgi:integrase